MVAENDSMQRSNKVDEDVGGWKNSTPSSTLTLTLHMSSLSFSNDHESMAFLSLQ
jgi:hypothetical protein